MVPLNAVVSASAEVAGTRARNAKIRTLAELLTRLRGAEIRPAAAKRAASPALPNTPAISASATSAAYCQQLTTVLTRVNT